MLFNTKTKKRIFLLSSCCLGMSFFSYFTAGENSSLKQTTIIKKDRKKKVRVNLVEVSGTAQPKVNTISEPIFLSQKEAFKSFENDYKKLVEKECSFVNDVYEKFPRLKKADYKLPEFEEDSPPEELFHYSVTPYNTDRNYYSGYDALLEKYKKNPRISIRDKYLLLENTPKYGCGGDQFIRVFKELGDFLRKKQNFEEEVYFMSSLRMIYRDAFVDMIQFSKSMSEFNEILSRINRDKEIMEFNEEFYSEIESLAQRSSLVAENIQKESKYENTFSLSNIETNQNQLKNFIEEFEEMKIRMFPQEEIDIYPMYAVEAYMEDYE